MQVKCLPSVAIASITGLAVAQPIASWDMQSVQDVVEAGVGFPRGNPVGADLAPSGMFGGLLEDNPVFSALRGGTPLGNGDDLFWYFNPLTGHVYPTAQTGAPAEFYNPSSIFGMGDGISYDVTATLDPNLDPGVSGRVEGAFYPISQYGNEFELMGTHTHEFMFRSNGDTTDLNGDGLWTGNVAPSGGPSTNGYFVPAKDIQVIWWHDGPARLLVNASEGAPGGLRMSIAGLDDLGNNLFASFDASARNYLNGEWVYVKLTYDADAPTVSGAQYFVEITSDVDPGDGVSLVTDRVVGNFDPSWAGLRPGEGANPLIGLRRFGDNFNGRQFDGFIDAIQISDGRVSGADMMGVTVPPPVATNGPVARWGMAPAFGAITDPRDPNVVLNPGESGVQPATLDRRTAAGEGSFLGGGAYTPTFPYGSREVVAQAGPGDDHLWCFTSTNSDADNFAGDFPAVAEGAPFWLFASGKSPAIVSSFDSSAFDAPASGSVVYPSDRYGDEMAFRGSFTLETVYKTDSTEAQTLIFQGEARERYSLSVSGSGVVFTLVDANDIVDLATLGNGTVDHVGGAWVYTRVIYDESAATITIASKDEFGNEDVITINSVPGFGPLPAGSDGNMFIGRDAFDPSVAPQNFSGLIDEVQITRGILASADALVLLSTDSVPPCSPADIDRDDMITLLDVIALIEILDSAPNCPTDPACAIADLDGSGAVDFFDLVTLLQIYDPSDPNCQGPAPRPNVILINVDDQGYGDMSAHGNPILNTPNLDRLYAESVRLTDFHVAPMCSPSRGQLITGRDAMRNGCTFVCQGRSMVRAEIPTIAEFFAQAGYSTSHVGKWHMGDSYPHRPQDRGFQDTFHHRAWGITSLADYWGNGYFDPVLNENGVDVPTTGYCADTFFDYAMDWIEQHESGGEDAPFFMYLASNTPHGPNVVANVYSDPYIGTFNGIEIPHKFYGMIANLDENVGRLDTFLANNNLRDNTIIIYMSDNGTQSVAARDLFNAGMRGMKQSVYEGGHRVPMFIRWPDGPLEHGRDVNELTQVQDVLPTLIELCDLSARRTDPGDAGDDVVPPLTTEFDGVSLAGLLSDSSSTLPDRKLVIQYRVSGEEWDPAVVLWDKWRLTNPGELYNIATDPGQTVNVAAQFPDVVQAMEDHYDEWYQEAKPQFDIERWIRVSTDEQEPMLLYAQDWVGDYCDNRGGLTTATAVGYWNIEVATSGVFDIELRRWPEESGLPLPSGFSDTFGPGTRGQRPVAAANVQVDGGNYTFDTLASDTSAVFRIHLDAGRHRLQTHLLDGRDQTICSAMYVQMTRVVGASPDTLTPTSSRLPLPRIQPGPIVVAGPLTLAPDDVLMTNFEGDDFGEWVSTGTAFSSGPVEAGNRIVGHEGLRVLDTFIGNNNSDDPIGSLTSPEFTVDRGRINFRIGGGDRAYLTQVDLIINGEVARSAVGNSTKDVNGRKIMQWVSWDVSEFLGSVATIKITDAFSGGWGHIVVDQIYRSNREPGQ